MERTMYEIWVQGNGYSLPYNQFEEYELAEDMFSQVCLKTFSEIKTENEGEWMEGPLFDQYEWDSIHEFKVELISFYGDETPQVLLSKVIKE